MQTIKFYVHIYQVEYDDGLKNLHFPIALTDEFTESEQFQTGKCKFFKWLSEA